MGKRPLLWAVVLFFAGIILKVNEIDIMPCIILLSAVGIGAAFAKRKAKVYFIAAVMLLSGAFVTSNSMKERTDIQSEFSGRKEKLTMTVTGFSEKNRVFAVFDNGKNSVKAYLSVKTDTNLAPGDIVEGEFALGVPINGKTQSFGFADYLSGKGTYLTARAEKVSVTGRKKDSAEGMIYSLRRYMNSVGKKHFKGDGRALFNAMLFGDKGLVSDRLGYLLQVSGLNHIAVVSGMHLSIIVAFMMIFIHKLFGKRRIGLIPAFAVAFILTLLTGAGSGVVRAFFMCSVFLLSQTVYRENDSLTSLSIAAFLMAVLNPFVIFDAGFVLSVLSVLGIILYNDKFRRLFEKFTPKKVSETLSLSLSAQLTVTPALAYYFGMVTPYALLSNLLVVALSSLYVSVGMIFFLIPKSILTESVLKLSSAGIIAVCKMIEKLPCAMVNLRGADMVFVLLWVFLLILIYMYPVSRKNTMIAAVFLSAMLLVLPLSAGRENSIRFFTFGGATMSVAEFSGDNPFIIDCPDSYTASELENVQCAVLTSEKMGGIFSPDAGIRQVFMPADVLDEMARGEIAEKSEYSGVKVRLIKDNESFRIGNAVLRYIPAEEEGGRALEIKSGGKVFITLQGLSPSGVSELCKEKTVFRCDFLKLPSGGLSKRVAEGDFCTGKIIPNNKFVLQW